MGGERASNNHQTNRKLINKPSSSPDTNRMTSDSNLKNSICKQSLDAEKKCVNGVAGRCVIGDFSIGFYGFHKSFP